MGPRYLADTNVLIDLTKGILPERGRSMLEQLIESRQLAISVVTKIELLGFSGPAEEMIVLNSLCDALVILPLEERVVTVTIEVRKSNRVKLGDAIIAATAAFHKLTLITRNTKDFKNLPGLTYINAHDH